MIAGVGLCDGGADEVVRGVEMEVSGQGKNGVGAEPADVGAGGRRGVARAEGGATAR